MGNPTAKTGLREGVEYLPIIAFLGLYLAWQLWIGPKLGVPT